MKRGDVVIVTQGEFGRPRPAIVVQADELGAATTTVLACPITSDVTNALPIRPTLEPTFANGLRSTSQVMTDKLAALRRDRIRRVIGRIDPSSQEALDRALVVVLGLAR